MLSHFVQTTFPEDKLIVLAKGRTAKIALALVALIKDRVAGIVLIAPDVSQELMSPIKEIPVLLVWSEEDPLVSFTKSKQVEEAFLHVTPLYFDHILHPGVSLLEAHNPELVKLDLFASSLQEWTQTLA
jgi:hypothetical protein